MLRRSRIMHIQDHFVSHEEIYNARPWNTLLATTGLPEVSFFNLPGANGQLDEQKLFRSNPMVSAHTF